MDIIKQAPARPYRTVGELSPREWEVMLGLASGKRATDIADELKLSVKTISTYRARILEKTGLSSNVELALQARKQRII